MWPKAANVTKKKCKTFSNNIIRSELEVNVNLIGLQSLLYAKHMQEDDGKLISTYFVITLKHDCFDHASHGPSWLFENGFASSNWDFVTIGVLANSRNIFHVTKSSTLGATPLAMFNVDD